MTVGNSSPPGQRVSVLHGLVLAGALVIALAGARPYAGGWNDGSRLATVECLVDDHTLAIDRSIFVQVPAPGSSSRPLPYDPQEPLLTRGTYDKLLINGHFYSDKSPVPALLLAGVYQGLQWCTGLTARDRPDLFCYAMTLASSGLAYVVAVWCVFQLGKPLKLPLTLRLLLTAGLALSTVALPYSRHVNNHILLLAVAAALWLHLAYLAEESRAGQVPWWRLPVLGTLAGLGYTIDLGAGPVLLAGLVPVLLSRCRRFGPLLGAGLAALPWLIVHHTVNYAVGGTFKPANAVAAYFAWPGCPFNAQTMTGTLDHSFSHFLVYGPALLLGKHGFLGHNLPLFLAVGGVAGWLRRGIRGFTPPARQSLVSREWPEVLLAVFWCTGTWLAYGLTSTNYSGQCCSIRWFVPLLAPGYYVLAVFVRDDPSRRGDLLVLSAWGAVLGGLMWWAGPWMKHMVPGFWPLQAAALLSWVLYRVRRRGQPVAALSAGETIHPVQAA